MARLILLSNAERGDRRDRYGMESRYDDQDRGYPENRFRDRRGREHYDDGRFAPMNDGGTWVDSRYYDDRRIYEPENHHSTTPYVPPVYERYDGGQRTARPMNRIGFSMDGEMGKIPPEFDRNFREDEMSYRRGGERMSGYGRGDGAAPLTRETAEEWAQRMENEDGSRGPHWNMDQTKQVQTQRGIDCDPLEFWLAMNMMYSDYCKVFKKHGVGDKVDFYAEMAKAFLDDKDARKDKLARYYECVVGR